MKPPMSESDSESEQHRHEKNDNNDPVQNNDVGSKKKHVSNPPKTLVNKSIIVVQGCVPSF